jgi:hypothetical protein
VYIRENDGVMGKVYILENDGVMGKVYIHGGMGFPDLNNLI